MGMRAGTGTDRRHHVRQTLSSPAGRHVRRASCGVPGDDEGRVRVQEGDGTDEAGRERDDSVEPFLREGGQEIGVDGGEGVPRGLEGGRDVRDRVVELGGGGEGVDLLG